MRILFLNCPRAIPTLQFKNISNFFEKYFIKNFFMKGKINWSRNAVCFASGTLRSFGILRCLLCWSSKRTLPFSFKNYFCFVWETLWANWVWALILKYTVLIVLEFSMSEAKFWVPLLEKIVQDCNREETWSQQRHKGTEIEILCKKSHFIWRSTARLLAIFLMNF